MGYGCRLKIDKTEHMLSSRGLAMLSSRGRYMLSSRVKLAMA